MWGHRETVLRGSPSAAFVQPGRRGGVGTWPWCAVRRAQKLGLPARAAGRALHRHRPSVETEGASACARACAPPLPGLCSCGDSAEPPAAPAPLLSGLLGEKETLPRTFAEVARYPLGQSINPLNQPCIRGTSGLDGWPGSVWLHPRPSQLRRPRPRFPRAPRAAPLRSACSPPPRLTPFLPVFSPARWSADVGVEEEDRVVSEQVRSLDSARGRPPLGSAATCSSRVRGLARRPPAPRPPSPALSPAQPRIAVAC